MIFRQNAKKQVSKSWEIKMRGWTDRHQPQIVCYRFIVDQWLTLQLLTLIFFYLPLPLPYLVSNFTGSKSRENVNSTLTTRG